MRALCCLTEKTGLHQCSLEVEHSTDRRRHKERTGSAEGTPSSSTPAHACFSTLEWGRDVQNEQSLGSISCSKRTVRHGIEFCRELKPFLEHPVNPILRFGGRVQKIKIGVPVTTRGKSQTFPRGTEARKVQASRTNRRGPSTGSQSHKTQKRGEILGNLQTFYLDGEC